MAAGEQGRGFGVAANEIRNLANQSQEQAAATQEIPAALNNIYSATKQLDDFSQKFR
ncbi:hypothetical protein GOM49_06275 [Clostridium bovifaecis]|uniref:Methyl-accepting transducer domain-containing protein n=1 Tax=Clostridium bovifaecis TaxID=2184719 RepID=A0A6I6EM07_9CLOT|nr:hypothetical protein GOM49_06275 [Clostridium bovifaecis]